MRRSTLTLCFNYRLRFSGQIFSLCIGFTCITYLILSNFPEISHTIINSKAWIQSIKNISNTQKFFLKLEQQQIPHLAQSENRSFICDRPRKNNGIRVLNVTSELDDHHINILRPYCDTLPIPRSKWIPARRYVESDIVFIIYTGAAFYHSRATAVRDTWLSRITHKYFFGATPYEPLPITVIERAGETYRSNIKKIYKGLQIAYQKHSGTAKFYFLAGCDTFVNVPHILKRLDIFDYKQPLIIGGFPEKHKCFIQNDLTKDMIIHPSAGSGFFLSSQMMKLIVPKLNSYFENVWPSTQENAHPDIALSCLAHSMGIKSSLVSGFWKFNPEQTLKEMGEKNFYDDLEPNTFHDIHPLSMHVLDEFYVHQLLDRLGYDKNFNELMKFTRHFVNVHYQLLRIKKRECKLPIVEII